MTILLTGGAGYIGSHTAVELIRRGYEIVVADNYSNSSPEVIDRIGTLVGRKVTAVETEMCDREAVDRLFRRFDFTGVIHFAGLKAVSESVRQPLDYYRVNLNAALTLLAAMGRYQVPRLVFSSSASVYGIPETVPIPESASAGQCASPYGRTKYMIEQMIADQAAAESTLAAVSLRYFNPVGAHPEGELGESEGGRLPENLMPHIIRTADGRQSELSVFGGDYDTADGTCVRDYIHIMDLASAHAAALEYLADPGHRGHTVFNVGTGKGYSVLEMIGAFEAVNRLTVPYRVVERRPGDVPRCVADPSRALAELGWKAEQDLADMCRDAWNWSKRQKA